MLFNTYQFIFLFLPIVLIGYYLIGSKSHSLAIAWLAISSLFFYAYWSFYALPILIASIFCNYYFGLKLSNINTKYRKKLLVLAIFLNLLALAYFKYVNFFIDNINVIRNSLGSDSIEFWSIALPIGISFFTFTQIAFIFDSYEGRVKEGRFLNYILFVSFFPHLVAGPVIHHKQMMPQFIDKSIFKINPEKFAMGILLFTIGLAKKMLLADPLGGYAEILFEGTKDGLSPQLFMSWMGSFAYSFQLYFDFSGYSDMAVGLGLLFGIWLPMNFNSPFKATSIIDFWQRWHISLTKYINEYLYVPITLRMVRLSDGKTLLVETIMSLILPTILIFLILGLWHGPSWTYIIFGLMHGIYIVSNHLWRKLLPIAKSNSTNSFSVRPIIGWAATFIAVNISFVMFRSDSVAIAYKIYKGMLGLNGVFNQGANQVEINLTAFIHNIWQYKLTFGQSNIESIFLLIIGLMIVLIAPSTSSALTTNSMRCKKLLFQSKFAGLALGALFAICVAQFGKVSPFLYFQF